VEGKRAAWLSPTMSTTPSEDDGDPPTEEMIEDLQRVAGEMSEPLTREKYQNNGYYSVYRIVNAFGSWSEATNAAGVESGARIRYASEDLLADLRRVGDELGRVPSRREYQKHGRFSPRTLVVRYGSWGDAQEAAGYDRRTRRIPDSDLLADMKRVQQETDREMRSTDYLDKGAHALSTVRDHFGGWAEAKKALADYDGEPADPPEDDGSERQSPDNRITREELLDDIERVAEETSRSIRSTDYDEIGNYSLSPVYRLFDSWDDAMRALEARRRQD
jgi:hypothetical protein